MELLGTAVGPSYTFAAAMHSNGETFTIDSAQQPDNVTDVRLRTINNHGDPSYIGAREFQVLGDSVTATTVFEAAMHPNGESFVLDVAAQPTDVTDIRLLTINNHGDPSYIGAREIQFLGPSVTETKTFSAAMHGNGETFELDAEDIPTSVTDVKFITIDNHGDPSYIGLREFELLGDSTGPSHTFTLAMTSTLQTITLDSEDAVTNVIGAKLITIKNHGDPSYTGMAEFRLAGTAAGPSYVFEAQMGTGGQSFDFTNTGAKLLRFHSLNNHGDPSYTGAAEFTTSSGLCGDAPAVDHIQIQHAGSALTCSAAPLTIKACADASCTNVANTDVTVTLAATGAASTWSANPLVIPANSSSGVNVNLGHTTAETVTLSASSNPMAANATTCAPNCDLAFSEAGYVVTLNNHQSCASENLVIQAVKLSDTGTSCAPAYTGSQSLGLSFNYLNPATGSTVPKLNSTDMATATVNQNRTVTFDGSGTATLAFSYADAGQISVNVSDAGTNGLSTGTVTTVVTPAKIQFAADANAQCTSGDASCTAFTKAGEAFNLAVMGACSDGTVTPNFAMDNIPLTVNTIAPTLGNPVFLGVTNVSIAQGSGGTHTITNQAVSEVGVFTITATPATNGYIGTTIAPSTSGNIGRFTPGYFELATTVEGSLGSGSSFAYSGQMDTVVTTQGKITYTAAPQFIATAKSQAGQTTLNYADTFAKLQASDVSWVAPSQDASQNGADGLNKLNLTANISNGTLTPGAGVLTYQFAASDNFVYTRETNALIAPFTADIDLRINAVTDSDGITANDTDADAGNGVLTLQPTGLPIRFGRWRLKNAFGPGGSNSLAVPMVLEYYDGNNFSLNTLDSFTTFDAATDVTITDIDLAPASTTASGNSTFANGYSEALLLSPAGAGNRGNVQVLMDVPDWLKFDWDNLDNQNDGPYDDNPKARATFGVYRGNDRVIYWREKR